MAVVRTIGCLPIPYDIYMPITTLLHGSAYFSQPQVTDNLRELAL